MSLGVPVAALELRPVDINDLALNTTLYYAADLSYVALDIGLSSALLVGLHLDRGRGIVESTAYPM